MNYEEEPSYESPISLQSPIDPRLVGIWLAEVNGTKLSDLCPVEPGSMHEITLRADGIADHRYLLPERRIEFPSPPPFPVTWETTREGMLSIFIPIEPMPEYEIPDWIQEAMRFDVLEVAPATLTLSNRPYDGEIIAVYRRVEEPAGDVWGDTI